MDCMRNHFVEGALLDGRFRTISPLNHGSFGMVFKALDTWTGEFVALKCLTKAAAAANCSPVLAVDDRSEELSIHRRIGNHPNIVNLVHHFETENHVYLVLEYCANGDLYEAIRIGRGPGQTEHVRECMLQLVSAVEHMHSKGIYHRDIKPENIFLSQSGAMKLGDFGLATTDAWSFESAVGSDRYMAPEQFDPSTTGYSPAQADVWAIGICLLNILFSRNPFATPTQSDPLFLDFFNDRQTLFDVFPNMSQDTFEVLVHCLAIDPAKRSLAAVRSALDRAVAFTTDDESLDDFCVEDTSNVIVSADREPLRTPSVSTPQLDQSGAFPWAKALAMTPPVRQLSAIPDTELYEDLFPASEGNNEDWFSVKPDNASVVSFVDSGLGVSLKSLKPESEAPSDKFTRSKPMPISGSLPASMARPIPSMAAVFGKKRDFVSKSWSDLWDEEEEAQAEAENEFTVDKSRLSNIWPQEEVSRDRVGLSEMKDPASVNNSRNRSPDAVRVLDHGVSEQTGFVFEDHHSTPTTTAAKYSTPAKSGIRDKWAALGELRRGLATPKKTPAPVQMHSEDPPRKRQNRAGSWRRNLNFTPAKASAPAPTVASFNTVQTHLGGAHRKDNSSIKEWILSKDWRSHAVQPAPLHKSCNEDVREIEWVWRNDLHL